MAVLILPLAAITLYGVIMRYVFHSPLLWGSQVMVIMFIFTAALPGGHDLNINSHVKLDMLYSRWSRRGRAIIDVATFAPFLLFAIIICMTFTDMAWTSAMKLETYTGRSFEGPVYPSKIALAIGAILVLLQGIAGFGRNIGTIMGKNKGEPDNDEH